MTSAAAYASVEPPTLLTPVHLTCTTNTTPVFVWNARFGAAGYALELRRLDAETSALRFDGGFEITETDPLASIAPVVRLTPDPLPLGDWTWRVACVDAHGAMSPWSPPRRFRIAERDEDAITFHERIAHPYLHLGRDRLEQLRVLIRTDGDYRLALERLMAAADVVVDLEIPTEAYARSSSVQHERYSLIGGMAWNRLSVLGMAWLLTEDPRYAEAGRDLMLAIAGYERWVGAAFLDSGKFDPIWHASLETAMTTYGMAVGYDWLHGYLGDDDRAMIRNAIVAKGVEPLIHAWANPETAGRIPRHQLPGGNWAMVCAGGAGVGALALLDEEPRARQWVRQVRDRVRWWLNYDGGEYMVDWCYTGQRPRPVIGPDDPNFGPDGGYRESIGYMNYAMLYVSYFSDSLRQVSGENLFAHVPPNILDPIVATIYRNSANGRDLDKAADFGDDTGNVAFHDLYACLMANSDGPLQQKAKALYDRVFGRIPVTAKSMLWYDGDLPAADLALPRAGTLFRGTGVAAFRGGRALGGAHAALKTRQNRGHHDIGAIYFYSGGETWITDSGSYNYAHPIYQQFLCRSKAQNLVLVDGQDQIKTDGQLEAFVAGVSYAHARCEAGAAYPDLLDSWTRDVVLIEPDTFLVVDRLRGKGTHRYDWLVHPAVPYELEPGVECRLRGRNDALQVRFLSPADWRVEECDGYDRFVPRTYLAVSPSAERENVVFFALLTPVIGEAGPVHMERGEDGGIALARRDLLILAACPGLDGTSGPGRLRTDAALALVGLDAATGDVRWAAMHDGAWLGLDGRDILTADRSVDLLAERHGDVVLVSADVGAESASIEVAGIAGPVRRCDSSTTVEMAPDGASWGARTGPGRHEIVLGPSDAAIDAALRRPAGAALDRTSSRAPVFRGARVRVSSAPGGNGASMIDGNDMTNWHTLPAQEMPQWCEVVLPRAQEASRITLCPTHNQDMALEVRGDEGDWAVVGRIERAPADRPVEFEFERRPVRRLRVVITRSSGEENVCGLWELAWR